MQFGQGNNNNKLQLNLVKEGVIEMASSGIDHAEIKLLNDNIDVLLSCKPLPESSIKLLCDKVSHSSLFYTHIVFVCTIQVSPSLGDGGKLIKIRRNKVDCIGMLTECIFACRRKKS